MARRGSAVHVVTTTRKYKGKVYRTHLLRRSYRENGKVKNETVANLSHLPEHIVDMIRLALRGETFVPADATLQIVEGGSRAHGHVKAVLTAIEQLGLPSLIASRPSRQRDLVVAMVAARILEPQSKLATTRWWSNTTLPELLGVGDADEDDLYEAMDWLLERQGRIERKLARRHLQADGLALYDLTSSYFEGTTCPLAARGHNRDGKKGKLQVNYGLLTNAEGVPVAVSVFEGRVSDPTTLLPQVDKVRNRFGIERFVLVGDRGMLTQKQIDAVRQVDGVDWISALRPEAIRKLVEGEVIQMGLFDERNLFEVQHPDYPGERLVACRNPELAKRRAAKRQSLLDATAAQLAKVQQMVQRGRLRGKDRIGVRVGKVVNKYKVAKHFVLDIGDEHFDFHIDEAKVAAEAALDGIYVVRTSLPRERMEAADAVRSYKLLSRAERAFRSMKTVDLMVRPIYHRLEKRVRAHIFLCMLAYYVLWHIIEAWRPLLFADEERDAQRTADPVAPATRSERAKRKASTKRLDNGATVHSVQTLLHRLAAIVRNTVRCPAAGPNAPTFEMDTPPDETQRRALELLKGIGT